MAADKEDWKYVHSVMENEGFSYCFTDYSYFEDIKDEKFHELRLKYLESAKELEEYVKNKYEESKK